MMNQYSILLVDDDMDNRFLLSGQLRRQGYAVSEAANGREALDMLKANHYDLMLLDLMLPELSGYEVLQEINDDADMYELSVVVISAVGRHDSVVRCLELGAEDYLIRPFSKDVFLTKVNAILEKKRHRTTEIAHLKEVSQQKDDLVHTTSHDLKNPLMVLHGYLHLLEKTDDLNSDEARSYLEEMRTTIEKMDGLVEGLLDLGKIEGGQPLALEDVCLADFIASTINGFKLLAQHKDITLEARLPPDSVCVSVDRQRMGQVFDNLLSNAIKYTLEGGRVGVRAEIDGQYAIVKFVDSGIGIPAEDIPHLFEKFFRVRRKEHYEREGTGLGLAIVKSIVDRHSGAIWVESQLGKGTVVNIQLPLTTDS